MQSQSELFIYSCRFSWLYKLEIITEWDARLHTQCSRTGILSCCSTVHSLEREGNDLLPGKWRGCCIKPWAKTQQLIFPQHYVQSDNRNYLILLRPATFVRQRENEGLNSPEEKHIKKKQPTTITYYWTFFFFFLQNCVFLFSFEKSALVNIKGIAICGRAAPDGPIQYTHPKLFLAAAAGDSLHHVEELPSQLTPSSPVYFCKKHRHANLFPLQFPTWISWSGSLPGF